MNVRNGKDRGRTAALIAALSLLSLAACTQSGPQDPAAGSSGAAATDAAQASGSGQDPDAPKVPFGNQPCQSLTADELKGLGIAKPAPAKPEPGHEPDSLSFDNTCDFGYQTLMYTTRTDYQFRKDNLRNLHHGAPADLPGAFYDTLGNLWFAEKGYYVTIPNNVADSTREKMARMIAARL